VASCTTNSAIRITFTDGSDYFEATFDQFTSPPRSYIEAGSLTFSTAGSSIQSGNSRAARQTWAIATYGTREEAFTINEMYRAWDTARADGKVAILGVVDQTFVRDPASPVTANAVFTAAPNFEQRAGNLWVISFGMTEV